jgi:hypothetical protein
MDASGLASLFTSLAQSACIEKLAVHARTFALDADRALALLMEQTVSLSIFHLNVDHYDAAWLHSMEMSLQSSVLQSLQVCMGDSKVGATPMLMPLCQRHEYRRALGLPPSPSSSLIEHAAAIGGHTITLPDISVVRAKWAEFVLLHRVGHNIQGRLAEHFVLPSHLFVSDDARVVTVTVSAVSTQSVFDKPRDWHNLFGLSIQIATALCILHAVDIVHGNVCLDSLCIDRSGSMFISIGNCWRRTNSRWDVECSITVPEAASAMIMSQPAIDVWQMGILLADLFRRRPFCTQEPCSPLSLVAAKNSLYPLLTEFVHNLFVLFHGAFASQPLRSTFISSQSSVASLPYWSDRLNPLLEFTGRDSHEIETGIIIPYLIRWCTSVDPLDRPSMALVAALLQLALHGSLNRLQKEWSVGRCATLNSADAQFLTALHLKNTSFWNLGHEFSPLGYLSLGDFDVLCAMIKVCIFCDFLFIFHLFFSSYGVVDLFHVRCKTKSE